MTPPKPVIEMRSVELSFGEFCALRSVDLNVPEGEKLVIFGPSGSGKSSLLRCISGLETPQAGEVRVFGTAINGDRRALRAARLRMAMIFQQFNLYSNRTALENVALAPRRLRGFTRSAAEELARDHLGEVGVGELASAYPFQLSGGQQQRVAIARALVHAPKLLLADEPTGNLDLHTGEKIIELLFELNADSGSTLVLVTHDEAIARRCQRVVRLHQGKLIAEAAGALPA